MSKRARKRTAKKGPAPRTDGAEANFQTIARNRRASYDYDISERYEAGLALEGSEIKSIRQGKASIAEAYVRPRQRELWLVGATIARYDAASRFGHEPTRDRKLLLHRREVREIEEAFERSGLTVIPIHLYIKRGLAKLEIGVGRGRSKGDKRQTMAKREAEHQMRAAVRR